MAMTTAIALSSLVHLCPRLRRVEGRGWGTSHGDDKEEKEGGWPLHIVVIALPTLPPPSGGDVISPARILANVLDNTFIGSKEEGVVMAVVELNGTTTTMTMTTLVCNAAAGKVVDNVPVGRGYDGQQ
jgi:hypothetical protein